MKKKAGIKEKRHVTPAVELKISDLETVIRSSREAPVKLTGREYQSSMMQLRVKEFEQVITMRTRWSHFLMVCVFIIILCQMALFFAVGKGLLKFEDEWLARILFPGIFGEILGFVYIIINYLFPNSPKNN